MERVATAALLGRPLNATEEKLAPPELWTQGDRALLARHPRVAVVGTRQATADGVRRAKRLVRELAKANAVIVSGLARGIDTIAHTTALAHGARTIAVIGTPLDQAYPRSNAGLQRTIGETELLVSQFAPGSVVSPGNFPRRNRTMALLAHASVIVEAGATSGAISAGWEALRLGRPLFLLRSLVDSGLPWPTTMLAHGAEPLDDLTSLLTAVAAGARP